MSAYTQTGHWLALVFFPAAWSFICPTEIRAFSARLEEFLYSRQCAVVFASTDSVHSIKAWSHTDESEGGLGAVHVPIISDKNHKVSRDYGVLIEDEGVAERAMFIIDPKGIVRYASISDVDIGRSVDETLRILDALAFKDEFGEGCPVNWKKGDARLKFADQLKVEGPITLDLKKSWSEWARPKLNRAWSNNSTRSVLSIGGVSSRGNNSPLVSPTSAGFGNLERNLDASIANMSMGYGIAN